uniref:Uncharacterized protein n=1 Tax=Candidatus Kentrum eta TaxID=2126337 RepID=A0A450VH29_9GAMM|nr:MAG: hypothetical protein BECKH772A_GA0070896_101684 [Candidatus Kentron sp. H]VFK01134.1 MAG: hypothetical protein BECKH772B_GA0070898_102194 [Candidatus Kentron sp. H]VFK04142.1 MAG: hypothetical protein BECKH772C_GA0070978_101634 [Candidatus Kentron sp. H]
MNAIGASYAASWNIASNAAFHLTSMKGASITPEDETTTPVGRVELRVTRQKCIKNVGLRR